MCVHAGECDTTLFCKIARRLREACSFVPSFVVAIEAVVGPQMVTVGGEVQPFRRCAERAREEPLEAHNSVRSDQSSGKARLDKVDAR